MSAFPAFVEATDDLDLDDLAHRAGVQVEVIEAIRNGGHSPSLSVMMRLTVALGFDRLFVSDDDRLLGEPRFAADPAVLRQIERTR